MSVHYVFKTIRCNIVAISEGNVILTLSHIFWTSTICSWAFWFNFMEEKKMNLKANNFAVHYKAFWSFQSLQFAVVVTFDQILWFWPVCEYSSFQMWFFWSVLCRAVLLQHFDFAVQSFSALLKASRKKKGDTRFHGQLFPCPLWDIVFYLLCGFSNLLTLNFHAKYAFFLFSRS